MSVGTAGGEVAFAASGVALDSDKIQTPLVVNVESNNRVVLTCAFGFQNITQFVVTAFMRNNGAFRGLSGGSALPGTAYAFGNAQGTTNARMNQNIPVLSVAQNDNQPGFQALAHTYVGPAVFDFIYLVGNLTGLLVVRVVATYAVAPGNNDFFTCGVNVG